MLVEPANHTINNLTKPRAWHRRATIYYCYPTSVLYNVRSPTLDNDLAGTGEKVK